MNSKILFLFKQHLKETSYNPDGSNISENTYSDVNAQSVFTKYATEFESFIVQNFGEELFEQLEEVANYTNENEVNNQESQDILNALEEELNVAIEASDIDEMYAASQEKKCNITSIDKLEGIELNETEVNVLNKLFGFENKEEVTDEKQLEADNLLASLIEDDQGITPDKIKILQEYIGDMANKNLSEDEIVKTIKMLDGKDDNLSKEDLQELAKLVKNKNLQNYINDAGIETNAMAEVGSGTTGSGTNAPASAKETLENMSLDTLKEKLDSAKTALDNAIRSVNAELADKKATAETNLKTAQDKSKEISDKINNNTTEINNCQSTIDSNNATITSLQAQLANAQNQNENSENTIDTGAISEQIAQLEAQNAELLQRKQELENENMQLETDRQEQEALITQYTNELTQINSEIATIATTNETVAQAQSELNAVQAMYDKRLAEQKAAQEVEILDVNKNGKDLRESTDLSNLPLTYELDGKTYHCPKFAAYDTDGDGVDDFQINSWEEFQRYALNAGICNVGKFGSMQCQNASAWYLEFALGVADLSIVNAMKSETESENFGNEDKAGYMTTTIGEEAGKNQRYLTKVRGNRDQTYDVIVNELKNGRPCVVSVPGGGSHYVLAMGISDDGDILIMDSYNCSMKKLGYANEEARRNGDKQHRNLACADGALIFSQGHTYLYGDNGDGLKNEDYWSTCDGDVDYRNWLAVWNSPNAKKLLGPGGRFEKLGQKYGTP